MSNLKAKIIALSWLIKKLGLFKTAEIFFEVFTKRPKEHLINFKFDDNVVRMRVMGLRTDLAMLTEVFCFESYEIKKQLKPKLIVDAGANKGSASIYFSLKYPEAKIHCYEPNIELIPVLKKNLELNKVNAEIFCEAISDRDGMVSFLKNDNHQYSKIVEGDSETQVKSISLSERYAGQIIDILKLDIEGEEEKVINSLDFINPDIRIIIQEIHYDRVNSKNIFSLLEKNNYKFEKPYSQYYYLNSRVSHPILLAERIK